MTMFNLLFITANIGTEIITLKSLITRWQILLVFCRNKGQLCEEFANFGPRLQNVHSYTLHDDNFNPSTNLQKFCGLIVLMSSCFVNSTSSLQCCFKGIRAEKTWTAKLRERLLEAACIVPARVIFRVAIQVRDDEAILFYSVTNTWVHAFNNLLQSHDF